MENPKENIEKSCSIVPIDSENENFETLKNKYTHVYLNIPFEQKDEAKLTGALWDKLEKRLYISKHRQLLMNKEWL